MLQHESSIKCDKIYSVMLSGPWFNEDGHEMLYGRNIKHLKRLKGSPQTEFKS